MKGFCLAFVVALGSLTAACMTVHDVHGVILFGTLAAWWMLLTAWNAAP